MTIPTTTTIAMRDAMRFVFDASIHCNNAWNARLLIASHLGGSIQLVTAGKNVKRACSIPGLLAPIDILFGLSILIPKIRMVKTLNLLKHSG